MGESKPCTLPLCVNRISSMELQALTGRFCSTQVCLLYFLIACHENATCKENDKSFPYRYECVCNDGFKGNGTKCKLCNQNYGKI